MYPGLVCAHFFVGGSGFTSPDMSGNDKTITLVNTDFVAGGLRVNANGEYGTISNISLSLVNSDIGTIIFTLKSLGLFNDGSNRRLIGGTIDASNYIYISKNNSNQLYFIFNENGTSHYIYATSELLPNWQVGTQVAFQWDKSANIYDRKKMAINVDGSYITPSGSLNADSLNTHSIKDELGIFNHFSDFSRFLNAEIENFIVFNRVLSSAELTQIYNNPSIVLGDKKRQYYQPIIY